GGAGLDGAGHDLEGLVLLLLLQQPPDVEGPEDRLLLAVLDGLLEGGGHLLRVLALEPEGALHGLAEVVARVALAEVLEGAVVVLEGVLELADLGVEA